MPERTIAVKLTDELTVVVAAEQVGPQLAADKELSARLSTITGSIEHISRETLAAVRRVSPSKGTIELSFGLAVEQGALVALFGKGKAEASITVTLEWEGPEGGN